uniref:Transmembrane protein n=1 Tax=Bursaphelenchus xylophilus TaxID=6326 RepID=A0A1I7SR20_BURXY
MGNFFATLGHELDKSNCIKSQNWTECLIINRQNILHKKYTDFILIMCLFIVSSLASGFIIYTIHSRTANPVDPSREFYRKKREKRWREVKNRRKLRENRLINGNKGAQASSAYAKSTISTTTPTKTPSRSALHSPGSKNLVRTKGKVAVLAENSGKTIQNALRKRWIIEMEDQQAYVDNMFRQQVYLYRMHNKIMDRGAKNK